jgi:DNA-binding CsgD family transcriptional regulator
LLLALVEGQEIESIEDQLIEAEHAQLIHHVQAGTFTFNHDKIRTCLYMEVSSSRRCRLHEAIGSILEAQYKAQSTKCAYLLAAIAFHFMNSGDTTRAVTYAMQAGEQALRSQAIEEAKSYYEMALQSLEPNDQRYGVVLLGLSEVALRVGDEQEAVAICENMLTWLAVPGRAESIGLDMTAQEAFAGEPGSHKHTRQVLQSAQNVLEKLNIREAAGRLRKLAALPHSERTFSGMIQTKPAAKLTVQPLPANLTKSEAKVLQLVVGGKRNRQIAEELGISEKTVANHLSHIFNKTTSENRAAATAFAIHHGIA